jgi:hypothetical protein
MNVRRPIFEKKSWHVDFYAVTASTWNGINSIFSIYLHYIERKRRQSAIYRTCVLFPRNRGT